MKYRDLAQRFANAPMTMLPERLAQMQAMILSHGADEDVDEGELRAALAAAVRAERRDRAWRTSATRPDFADSRERASTRTIGTPGSSASAERISSKP